MQNNRQAKGSERRCPICRDPAAEAWRPFCSRRCADVDLGRWLGGSYAFPGEPADLSSDPEADEAS
ncbi:MAG TPA: DNA gyrase inhibitor YacG [Thermohalobaculum sp.]|nr:DNA gyrase inhibitor YacG [Thermohalobaculum sp.]